MSKRVIILLVSMCVLMAGCNGKEYPVLYIKFFYRNFEIEEPGIKVYQPASDISG